MLQHRFARLAWGVLAYNLLVIMFGAFVRATGSGAGCGRHWPLCNGTVLQRDPAAETIIELAHRLTSGLALLCVIGLVLLARRAFPSGHWARQAAWGSLALIVVEALVGASLVLLELVADNDSIARAAYLGVHLINTFLLVAALSLTAWWAARPAPTRPVARGAIGPMLVIVAGLVLVGVSGAITALGDTLFPSATLAEGLRQDVSPTAHVLLRLRVLHPLLAVVMGLSLLLVAVRIVLRDATSPAATMARTAGVLVMMQLALGIVNLVLLAPTALQLVHLLLADLVWIAAVLLTAALASEPARAVALRPGLDAAAVLQR